MDTRNDEPFVELRHHVHNRSLSIPSNDDDELQHQNESETRKKQRCVSGSFEHSKSLEARLTFLFMSTAVAARRKHNISNGNMGRKAKQSNSVAVNTGNNLYEVERKKILGQGNSNLVSLMLNTNFKINFKIT